MAELLVPLVKSRCWPLLGRWPTFQADATGFLLRLAREAGDVARFRLGRTEAVLLSHPDQVRSVLVDHAGDFTKGRLMQRARRLLGDGLLTSEGELHRTQRRLIQPVFARERLYGYGALIPGMTAEHTERWREGARIPVDAEMEALTMEIIARTMLGVDLRAEVPALARSLRRLSRWAPLLAAPGGQWIEGFRLPLVGSLGDALETVERVIARQIEQGHDDRALIGALRRRADGKEASASSGGSALIRDEVMTIFLAGHDTTAAALTWVWILLSRHEAAYARLRSELAAVLRGRRPRVSDLESLRYTRAVVKETLRLYPPVGRIGRRPVRDLDLGPPLLRKDTAVFLSPYVTQRDPRWYDEPESFRPERWLEPEEERPRFAWFPFGAGPRSCVGEHLAVLVMALVVATIAPRWQLHPISTRLPRARSLLTLKPRRPVWMVTTT